MHELETIRLIISDSKYNYGKYHLEKHKLNIINVSTNSNKKIIKNGCRKIFKVDCVFVHYLIKELILSEIYRILFINKYSCDFQSVKLILNQTKFNLIDYKWNDRIYHLVRERCELDHALSWLSTLGGAFSALGDYFANCAETAGKISFHQLKLALRLGDPTVAARCRLYFSLSLIQRHKYKAARSIILKEYEMTKSINNTDVRLLKMCQGIWAKLQYEHDIYRKNRLKKSKKNLNING